jgi:hypothetical protein
VITEVRVDNEPIVLDQGRVVTDPGLHSISVKVEAAGGQGAKVIMRNAKLEQGDNPDLVMDVAEPDLRVAAPAAGKAEVPPARDGGSSKRIVGIVLTGVGAVALGVGTYMGIDVLNRKKDADRTCYGNASDARSSGPCVSADAAASAMAKEDDAKPLATVSTILIPAGLVSVGAGVYFLLTAGSEGPAGVTTGSVRIQPNIGLRSVGVSGAF